MYYAQGIARDKATGAARMVYVEAASRDAALHALAARLRPTEIVVTSRTAGGITTGRAR
jgi:hypothetical protein